MLESIAGRVDQTSHPLLTRRPGTENGSTLLIAITADRGLCGSFNTNVIKATGAFLREHPGRAVSLGLVGRKGRDMLGRRGLPVRGQRTHTNARTRKGPSKGVMVKKKPTAVAAAPKKAGA